MSIRLCERSWLNSSLGVQCRKHARFKVAYFADDSGHRLACAQHLAVAVLHVSAAASGDAQQSTETVRVTPL